MNVLFLILTIFKSGFASTVVQRWAYIYEYPSKQWETAQSGRYSFSCAYGLLNSHLITKRLSEGASVCEKSLDDNFLPEYYYYRMTVRFTKYLVPDGTRERLQYYLSREVQVGDKFRFVFLKNAYNKFEITFKSFEDDMILNAVDSRNIFILRDVLENGSVGIEEEMPMYPFSVFKEYTIVFEVLVEHWKIYVDDIAVTTFIRSKAISEIEKIQILAGSNITIENKSNVYIT